MWWGGRHRVKDGNGNVDGKRVKRGEAGEEMMRNTKVLSLVPVVYGVVAGVEAVLAGSVVGLM